MARLINADALKDKKIPVCTYDKENGIQSCDIVFVRHIDEAPTVDAAEVVLCKDCKHYGWEREPYRRGTHRFCRLHKGLVVVYRDTFCSYGERKDNG